MSARMQKSRSVPASPGVSTVTTGTAAASAARRSNSAGDKDKPSYTPSRGPSSRPGSQQKRNSTGSLRPLSGKAPLVSSMRGGFGLEATRKRLETDRDTVVLSLSEFERIKANSGLGIKEIVDSGDGGDGGNGGSGSLPNSTVAAPSRRELILAADAERKRVAPVEYNVHDPELERMEREERQMILDHADMRKMEEIDEIKTFNRRLLAAQAAAVCDAQVEEKKVLQGRRLAEDRLEDARMEELNRQDGERALAAAAERKAKEHAGVAVLVSQIAERESVRQQVREQQEVEAAHLQTHLDELKQQAADQERERRERQKFMHVELLKANEEQVSRKQEVVAAEKEDDVRMAKFIEDKARREADMEEERDFRRREREKEWARLAAEQQKAIDMRAEEDAVRAKRAALEKERAERRREADAKARLDKMERELGDARREQTEARRVQQVAVAVAEKEDRERYVRQAEEERLLLLREAAAARDRRKEHMNDVQGQIGERDMQRKQARNAEIEETWQLRRRQEEEAAKLRSIKEQKLKELESYGLPEKYKQQVAKGFL